MSSMNNVAVFWDYENCHPPSNMTGHEVVGKIRRIVAKLGRIKIFKAYLDVLLDSKNTKSPSTLSELHLSGVSLVHCPHYGLSMKDVADKTMIVDIMSLTNDWAPPSTVVLISGDRDFSYALSTLCLQGYEVIVVSPSDCTHTSLKALASTVHDWYTDVLGVPPQTIDLHAKCNHASSRPCRSASTSTVQAFAETRSAVTACCRFTTPASPSRSTLANEANVSSELPANSGGTNGFAHTFTTVDSGASGLPRTFHDESPIHDQPPVSQTNPVDSTNPRRSSQSIHDAYQSGPETPVITSRRYEEAQINDAVEVTVLDTSVDVVQFSPGRARQSHIRVDEDDSSLHPHSQESHPFSSVGSTPIDPFYEDMRDRQIGKDDAGTQDSDSTSSSSPSRSDSSRSSSPHPLEQAHPHVLEELSPYDAARSRTTTSTSTLLNGSGGHNPPHSFDALRKLDLFMNELQGTNSSTYQTDRDHDDVGIRVEAISATSPSDPFADPVSYTADDLLYGTATRSGVYSREASVYSGADNYRGFEDDRRSSTRSSSPDYVATKRVVDAVYFLPSKSADVPSLPIDIPLSSDDDEVYEAVKAAIQTAVASSDEKDGDTISFAEQVQQTRCSSEPPLRTEGKLRNDQDDTTTTLSEQAGNVSQYSTASEAWQWVSDDAGAAKYSSATLGSWMDGAASRLGDGSNAQSRATEQTYDTEHTPMSYTNVLGKVPSARSSSASFHSVQSGSSDFGTMSQKAVGKRPAVSMGIPSFSNNSYDSAVTETVLDWRHNYGEGISSVKGNYQTPAAAVEVTPLVISGKVASAAPSTVSSAAPSTHSTQFNTLPSTSAQSSTAASNAAIRANVQKFKPLVDIMHQELRNGGAMASSQLGSKLLQHDSKIYVKAGVSKLKAYLNMARDAGVIAFLDSSRSGEIAVTLNGDYATDAAPPPPPPPTIVAPTPVSSTGSIFDPLISSMRHLSPSGHALASVLGEYLAKYHKGAYERAGVRNFTQYVGLAEKAGIVRYEGEYPHLKRWVVFGMNAGRYGA